MSQRSEDALVALRQIQRKTEMAAKRLAQTARLTPSQLTVLQILNEPRDVTAGDLARLTQLKHATITSIVDKLVARNYVQRRLYDSDRRRVWLELLPDGRQALSEAPDSLQQTFTERFGALPDWQQSMLVASLERVAVLLDAEDLDVAPVLDFGELDTPPPL